MKCESPRCNCDVSYSMYVGRMFVNLCFFHVLFLRTTVAKT